MLTLMARLMSSRLIRSWPDLWLTITGMEANLPSQVSIPGPLGYGVERGRRREHSPEAPGIEAYRANHERMNRRVRQLWRMKRSPPLPAGSTRRGEA